MCEHMRNANKKQWVAKRVTKSRWRDKTVARMVCNNYIVLLLVSYIILLFFFWTRSLQRNQRPRDPQALLDCSNLNFRQN